jgi:small-conductance mechanosensitive channel
LSLSNKISNKTTSQLIKTLLHPKNWAIPLHLSFLALGLLIVFPLIRFPEQVLGILRHLLSLSIISTISFILIRLVGLVRKILLQNYDLTERDNLKARAIHTQFKVIEQILIFVIVVIAIASILMTFEKIRQIGVSLLASAGVVGIIVGFAAQRSIATILAGIQIALTQPIRIEDVVIVEGEWGRIEEITLTYAVVRIWDLRRLIVPITYFIEKPFQNWTRVSADLLGTVYIYVDYTVPLEAIRNEFTRLLNDNPLWDKKVCVTHVTNTTERTVEVRLLMSAEDASKGWELRCFIREKLIDFLQKNYPQALPRVRLEVER